jgi:hypothetical protein
MTHTPNLAVARLIKSYLLKKYILSLKGLENHDETGHL